MMWHSTRRYPCPCKLLDTELYKVAVHSWIPCAVQDATKCSTFRGARAHSALAYYPLALISNIYRPKTTLAQTNDNHPRMRKRQRKPAHGSLSEVTPDLNENNWDENPTPLILMILGLKYGSKKGQASSICQCECLQVWFFFFPMCKSKDFWSYPILFWQNSCAIPPG